MVDAVDNFYSCICGKLLGDGSITKQGHRNPRFQFMHRTEDLGWTNYCYNQLKSHIPLSPPTYKKVTDHRMKKGFSESYVVQSRTDEIITNLYAKWYPNDKKPLPFDYIEQFLDEQALAWWYQDDGHLKLVRGSVSKIVLSTDSFSAEENNQLIQLLFNKFKIRFLIDGQNRLLLYDQFQIIYFLHLVSPWLNESMNRKSMPQQPLRSIAKRTTIYLPGTYKLIRPTAEINGKLNNLDSLFSNSSKYVCIESIFSIFTPIIENNKDVKGYQIIIDENHRQALARIRQQTGLTISQLVQYCFKV